MVICRRREKSPAAVLLFGAAHILARLCRTRIIGGSSDVKFQIKICLHASMTPIFI